MGDTFRETAVAGNQTFRLLGFAASARQAGSLLRRDSLRLLVSRWSAGKLHLPIRRASVVYTACSRQMDVAAYTRLDRRSPMKHTMMVLGLVLAVAPAFAQTRSVYTEDLTWYEVRDAMAAGKTTAIVFAGGIEQNGPHMAVIKHNAIARYTAGKIAEQLGNALVYPIVPFSPAGDPVEKTGHS